MPQHPAGAKRPVPAVLAVAVTIALAGLLPGRAQAGTHIVDEKLEAGVTPAPLKKICVLALAKDAQVGRTAERTFVEKMEKVAKQTTAIPFFKVIPGEDRTDMEKTKALLAAAGVDGLVVFRVLERDEVTQVNDSTIAKQAWNNMLWWGYGAWYGPGVGAYWGADLNSASVKKSYALIEAALYTAAEGKLAWTARTKSLDAKSVEEVLEKISSEVAGALRKAKFVN